MSARERGQMVILMMLVMTVVFVIGLIIVDVGIWFTERRGASSDADASSLAGVQAYLADLTDTAGAFDDAATWAALNGVDPAKIDALPTLSCSADNSCIGVGTSNCREDGTGDNMPWVEAKVRADGARLFTTIFNVLAPDIGASARACVGSPRGLYDLSPFGIQTGFVPSSDAPPESGDQCLNDEDDDFDGEINDGCPLSSCMEPDPDNPGNTRPVYGSVCILKTHGSSNVAGQFGLLTIGGDGCSESAASGIAHGFHYGTVALCTFGEEVDTGTGSTVGLLQNLRDRLKHEGLCETLFSTGNAAFDDFDEVFSIVGAAPGVPVVASADAVFAQNDCDVNSDDSTHSHNYDDGDTHTYMPRVMTLVLVDQFNPGNVGSQTATITGFAGFYIIGCFPGDDAFQVKAMIEQDLTNFDSFMNRCEKPNGQDEVIGIFVKQVAAPIFVGDPDPNLPLAIVLVK